MSIDLYIFPTSSEYFYWGELKDKFLELLTPEDSQRLGTVSLKALIDVSSTAGIRQYSKVTKGTSKALALLKNQKFLMLRLSIFLNGCLIYAYVH